MPWSYYGRAVRRTLPPTLAPAAPGNWGVRRSAIDL